MRRAFCFAILLAVGAQAQQPVQRLVRGYFLGDPQPQRVFFVEINQQGEPVAQPVYADKFDLATGEFFVKLRAGAYAMGVHPPIECFELTTLKLVEGGDIVQVAEQGDRKSSDPGRVTEFRADVGIGWRGFFLKIGSVEFRLIESAGSAQMTTMTERSRTSDVWRFGAGSLSLQSAAARTLQTPGGSRALGPCKERRLRQ